MAGAMPAASLILCFLSNRPLRAVIRLNSGWAIVALVCCLSKARFRLTLYSPCRVFLRINCWQRRPAPVSCSPLSIRPCQYTPNIRFPTANLRLAPCLSGVRPAYFPPQARFLAFLYIRLMYHAMRLILRPAPARRTARMLAAAAAFLRGDPALRRSAARRRRFFGPFSKYAQYTLSCG